jgi:vanillate O-demethylase ferredoxin subunit
MKSERLPYEVTVLKRTDSAVGVMVLDLVPIEGGKLPSFEPGAHIDVLTPGGVIRQYSLCNNPETSGYRLGILLNPNSRGGSASMHSTIREGDRLQIGAPRNLFPLLKDGEPSLLLAGGIGITPLLAMAWHLHVHDRPFVLHYFVRSRARAAFAKEILEGPFSESVHMHADDDVRIDLESLLNSYDRGHLYLCGPEGFMEAVIRAADLCRWDQGRVHKEHFQALPFDGVEKTFTVVAARSGATCKVSPGEKIADVLEAAGVDVQLSCEQGVCGTCLTRIIEGMGDHRDSFQNSAEKALNTHLAICCSSSLSERLVLDI